MAERKTGAKRPAGANTGSESPALANSASGSDLVRLPPLAGRYGSGAGVTLIPVAQRLRVALRVSESAHASVGDALGLTLPTRPKTSVSSGPLSALWLGPDEWLLIGEGVAGEDDGAAALVRRLDGVPDLSAVDVSHRNVAVAVEGPAAEAVIAAGCPQDIRLRTFPVGSASRTVLSKAEIVLWRRSESRFEVECWRSFADYVWTFLSEAARDPAV